MASPTDVRVAPEGAVPSKAGTTGSKRLWLALRIAVPLLILAGLVSVASVADTLAALRSVPLSIALAVFLLIQTNLLVAALRWRVILRACGNRERVSLLELFRLHWIGSFYNKCVPGGVGGDVLRAIATRRLFASNGIAAALAVVFLERLLGLCGLLLLVTVSFTISPLPGVPNVMLWSALGMLAIAGCVVAILLAPKLAPHMPGPLKRVLEAVPVIESFALFGLGVALSVVTQSIGVVNGYIVIASIAGQVTVAQSFVVMPLVLASQYFPLSVGGAGVRELAFVALFGLIGVARPDALAASLVITGLEFLSGATGGVVQTLRPLTVATEPTKSG